MVRGDPDLLHDRLNGRSRRNSRFDFVEFYSFQFAKHVSGESGIFG
jgi:hypothetical protein